MVKIISLNVRGLANLEKRRIIFKLCRDRGDIILLQETHSTPEFEQQWKLEWGGQIIFAHHVSNSCGVCIMFKKDIDVKYYT